MKTLIAAFLIVSSSAFATDRDATEVLLSVLPSGEYSGVTFSNSPCSVSVRNLSNRVAVVATAGSRTTRSEVFIGATYAIPHGGRTFYASVMTTTLRDRRENFVRTVPAGDTTQYVAVGDIITSSESNTVEKVVECVINL